MAEKTVDLEKIIRKAFFVPESKRIDSLLREFKRRHVHIAVAIDEYVEKSIKDDFDTEFSFIYKETEKNIMEEIKNNLTEFEKDVFKYKIDGYSFEEIANTLNKDLKSIYNTFHRIKSKIKKIIKDDDYL